MRESECQGRKLLIEALADTGSPLAAPGGKPPVLGRVVATTAAKNAMPDGLDAAQVVHADGLPGRGQFYCSLDTLAWLAFDVETAGMGDSGTRTNTDLAAARRTEARTPDTY